MSLAKSTSRVIIIFPQLHYLGRENDMIIIFGKVTIILSLDACNARSEERLVRTHKIK